MMVRTLGIAGVGALGLAAVGFASPAGAISLVGCGDLPSGATASFNDGVCQLDFSTAGAFNWTLPTGITGLHALLVGGGGGAYADGNSTGYAGSGGTVLYVDYSAQAAGDPVSITVGAGGVSDSSDPTDGGDTTVDLGALTLAGGGAAGGFFTPGYCVAAGNYSTYVGTGDGAGGSSGPDGDDCATTVGPGVNPSLGNADSDSTAVPAVFSSLNATFGMGGQVVVSPIALPSGVATGAGASVQYVAPSTIPSFNSEGSSGRVVLRYTMPAVAGTGGSTTTVIAATGTDFAPQLGVIAATGVLGALLLAFSRRRRGAKA